MKCFKYGGIAGLSLGLTLVIGYYTPSQWLLSRQADCTVSIYVVGDRFHTNFLVPTSHPTFDWRSQANLVDIGPVAETAPYLMFGWGDRDFYMHWQDGEARNAWSIFKAAFLPTPSVMQVAAFTQVPAPTPAFTVQAVQLSAANYFKLSQFIAGSFQAADSRGWRYIAPGLERYSAFYEAIRSYSVLYTCNSWTAEGLRLAQINTPIWPGLAPAIFQHLQSACG